GEGLGQGSSLELRVGGGVLDEMGQPEQSGQGKFGSGGEFVPELRQSPVQRPNALGGGSGAGSGRPAEAHAQVVTASPQPTAGELLEEERVVRKLGGHTHAHVLVPMV